MSVTRIVVEPSPEDSDLLVDVLDCCARKSTSRQAARQIDSPPATIRCPSERIEQGVELRLQPMLESQTDGLVVEVSW